MTALAAERPLPPLAPARPAVSPWLVIPIVAMAAFMEVLDITIVNVALPHIAGNLSVTVDESTWVLTSYLVANAIILPLNGFFSSLLGRKPYFMLCLALFTTSSLLCGLAPNLPCLLTARIVQGLGGGGLQPGAQAIMAESLPRRRMGMAMAAYGIVVVVAPIIGPLLGGYITDHWSWRWCFFLNVPVGAIVLPLVYAILRDAPHHRPDRSRLLRWDYTGLLFLSLGVGALQIMVDRGQEADWFSSPLILGCAVTAAIGLVAALIWEWYTNDPIVNFRLLKDRNFGLTTLGMLIFGAVLFSSTVLLPLLAQTLMGYNASEAGLVLAPGGMVVLVLMPLVAVLVTRVHIRWLITVGVVVNVIALEMMARLSLHASFADLVACRVVQGLGLAFMFVPINTAAFAFLPPRQIGSASGIINLARNIGGSVGISLTNTYVTRRAQTHQVFLSSHVTPLSHAYHAAINHLQPLLVAAGAVPSQALHTAQALIYRALLGQTHMLGYIDTFRVLGVIFLAALPLLLLVKSVHHQPVRTVME